ncbi:MAG: host-nuclease inhibitor Gam family protein [Zoogloeaceae bacterium]|jgi:phage host-nuclease inhibitor protein Gam|nr:host-nuclease inhibitor Gam family protein [Zoogloeaceae bacterium]
MATKTKAKRPALLNVCQSRAETQTAIREYGDVQRELTRLETELNDAIAQLVDAQKESVDALKTKADGLLNGIQLWCETNRAEIVEPGQKTANLLTGEVAWRQNPPSVSVKGEEAVVELLRAKKLYDFIRVIEKVNKEAILNNPEAVNGVAGIKVITGKETFYVTPFEVEFSGSK